jgi:hypothetical protein
MGHAAAMPSLIAEEEGGFPMPHLAKLCKAYHIEKIISMITI